MRKVIQITVSAAEEGTDLLYALCDDGSMWWASCRAPEKWHRIEGVPQDKEQEEGRKGS